MPTDPTPDLLALLDTLDGLHKAATEGEWQFEPRDGPFVRRPVSPRYERGIQWLADAMTVPDGASVVALHNAYPRLAQALRTALTPTTDGEREARALLESLPKWGTYGWRESAASVASKLAENARQISDLLRENHDLRTKAADAARERAAIVADLQAAADDLDLAMREPGTSGADLTYFRGARDALLGKIAHYKSGAHNKVTP
jgi:hypothetical protein